MNENASPIKNGDYPLSCQFSAGVKKMYGILGATIQSVDYHLYMIFTH